MSLPPPIKTASNEQPVLGAHVLSEFVFCRRAGFLTLQMEPADEGEDPAGFAVALHFRGGEDPGAVPSTGNGGAGGVST